MIFEKHFLACVLYWNHRLRPAGKPRFANACSESQALKTSSTTEQEAASVYRQFLHSCCRAEMAKALQASHPRAIVKPAMTVKSAEWLESIVGRAKPGTVPLSLVSFC